MNKRTVSVAALGALAGLIAVLPAPAQMGMQMGPPQLSGIWNPVVGQGAAYEDTDKKGDDKSQFQITIVGKEDVDGAPGFWMEIAVQGGQGPMQNIVMKMLMQADATGMHTSKTIMQMAGRPPMEMPIGMMGGRGSQTLQPPEDFRKMGEHVGEEKITTPAGTFDCEHWRGNDKKTDVWLSKDVTPWALVKSTNGDSTMTLIKVITDAKSQITGTPVKFDPSMFMRNPGM